MAMGDDFFLILIFTFAISFIPSIIYTIAIRNTEKYEREPWSSVWMTFLWGATMSIIVILIVKGWFITEMAALRSDPLRYSIILYCFVIPFAAETVKPIGLTLIGRDMDEGEDGLVYGAAIGLGFAASDTLLYGVFQVSNFELGVFANTVLLRSFSVVLLHAAATSLTGYGISRGIARIHGARKKIWAFPLFILAAMAMHGIFNYFVLLSNFNTEDPSQLVRNPFEYGVSNMMIAVGFAVVMMIVIYLKIYRLDRIEERAEKEKRKQQRKAKKRAQKMRKKGAAPATRQRPTKSQNASAPSPAATRSRPPTTSSSRPPPSSPPPPPPPPPDDSTRRDRSRSKPRVIRAGGTTPQRRAQQTESPWLALEPETSTEKDDEEWLSF